MTEHEVCKGCIWNYYPICKGTIMHDGNYMNIEALRKDFQCGQKEREYIFDFSEVEKTEEELKIEELEARIAQLEASLAVHN